MNNRLYITQDFTKDCVLRTYLIYLFLKAEADNKIIGSSELKVFHTGFFRHQTDPIFMIWGKFTPDSRQSHLFLSRSSQEFRDVIKTLNNRIPEQTKFPKLEFDVTREIIPEHGHIIKERFNRFPDELFLMLRQNPRLEEATKEYPNEILADRYFNYFRRMLIGCIKDTHERLLNQTEEAVPYWHKSTNKMCWLIPLRFGISEEVNLALVLEPTEINSKPVYRAFTIIPLKEAFKSSRVVGRVMAGWLQDKWKE